MDDAENNSCKTTVKKEIEEDWSNSEMSRAGHNKQKRKQEVDYYVEENGSMVSVDSIKKECKQEIDWELIKNEGSPDAENSELVSNLETNFNVIQHNESLFQCPKCPVKAKYKANLNRHISFMHSKNNDACKKRKFWFKNKHSENHELGQNESMNSTQLLKKKKYAYSCSNCFFNCNCKQDLVYHVYQFHFDENDSQNKYPVCPHCNKKLYQYKNQKAHVAVCTGGNIFQCDHCSHNTTKKEYLKKHIFTKHFIHGLFQNEPSKQYILPACPKCGKRYEYSATLSNHIAFCGKLLPFQCKACLYASDDKKRFITHILAHLKKSNLCQDLV